MYLQTLILISSHELSGRSVAVHFCFFCGVSMHNSSSMSTMRIVLFAKGIIVFPLRVSSFGIMLKCIERRTDFCWFWKTFSFMLSGFSLCVEDNCMVDNVFKCCILFLAVVADKHVSENSRKVQIRIFLFYLYR